MMRHGEMLRNDRKRYQMAKGGETREKRNGIMLRNDRKRYQLAGGQRSPKKRKQQENKNRNRKNQGKNKKKVRKRKCGDMRAGDPCLITHFICRLKRTIKYILKNEFTLHQIGSYLLIQTLYTESLYQAFRRCWGDRICHGSVETVHRHRFYSETCRCPASCQFQE